MTVNDLIQLRDEIRRIQSEMDEAERDLTLSRSRQQAAESAHDAGLVPIQTQAESGRDQLKRMEQKYQQELDGLIEKLNPDVPIALLPVRLETRFKGKELWVRIYPDDIHQDTHEPELTRVEVEWGERFWQEMASGGTDKQKHLQAWGQLAGRFGPNRAAWIANATEPGKPRPGSRQSSWTRAPHTKVLPDRWLVIGYADGDRIVQWSELIPDPLATGPQPDATNLDSDNIDEGMRWMVDFETAVKQGMGIRLLLTEEQAKRGLNRLLVLGVKGTLDSTQSAELLQSLLDAHHYTWGLGAVPIGTPTNNSGEARSGYVERDPGYERSFAAERGDSLCQPGDGSDGAKAAVALGLSQTSPFVFAHMPHADGHEQQDAGRINMVMWNITWGYFLTQMMDNAFRPMDPERWQDYFVKYVRARGPFPTLRVGNQPYGLLPVTWLDRFVSGSGAEQLIDWLRILREPWREALGHVPYSNRRDPGTNTIDPDRNLLTILGMEATSSSYIGRHALGPLYTQNLWWFLSHPVDAAWTHQRDAMTQPALTQFNLPSSPFLSQVTFDTDPFEVSISLVQAEPVSETEALKDNYIAWLCEETPQVIHDQSYPSGPPKTLLYRLLRHATLGAYASAALQIDPVSPPLMEPELIDMSDLTAKDPVFNPHTKTTWRHLNDGPPYGHHHDQELYNQLGQDPSLDSPAVKQLRTFLKALNEIGKLPTAALERLLAESLDLASYRLDAWITSCATWRLNQVRQPERAPTGIYLGGYGWVEDLRPRSAETQSTGYVHAPSLAHASAAAVLRSGYLSHKDSGKGDVLALDLSSRRVRLAKWLLDGVRKGQPLSALLGYRFERGLHENHPNLPLDQYIVPFRELAPLVAGKLIPKDQNQSLASIAANNVVDGLALLRRYQEYKTRGPTDTTIPFGNSNFPSLNSPEAAAVIVELEALADIVDAVSDILVAESVYQAIQGNPLRSGASLDAISRGEAPPQELEIARTPRTGIGLTHRVLVLFSGGAIQDGFTAKWEPSDATIKARQVRAAAEPHLNAWAAKLLGDPAQVICRVEYLDPITKQALLPPRTITLLELNLCPLDVLYASLVSEQAQRSDLEQWLVYYAMQTRPTAPVEVKEDVGVRLIFARDEQWTSDKLSFPELLEIARAARDLIVGARALDARDVAQPGQGILPSVKADELTLRANSALGALQGVYDNLCRFFAISDPNDLNILGGPPLKLPGILLNNLDNLLALPAAVDLAVVYEKLATTQAIDLNQLRDTLLRLAYFGIPNAVPLSPGGQTSSERATLITQARALAKNVEERKERAADLLLANDPLGSLQEVFGRGFRVLPQFTAPTEFSQALARRAVAQDAQPQQVIPWFQRLTRIREGAGRLDITLMYAEAIGAGDRLDFRVAQLPNDPQDQWVGLEAKQVNSGRLSLVAHTPATFDPTQFLAGLLVDEWVEVVPNPTETTALTFHYDAPGACAPQAILLAVPPELDRSWDMDTLEGILLETLELAKLRAVDPDALAAQGYLGHYLPALYFAYNKGGDPNGDTIATDFKS